MTLETTTNIGANHAAGFQRFVNFEHHFVGVNKMVPAGHSERGTEMSNEARELDVNIAENVVELVDT